MTKRVIEISSGPLRINVQHYQLLLTFPDSTQKQLNTEDVGVLILDHPGISFNVTVLNALTQAGITLVVCGPNHLPASLFLPVSDHTLQTERFRLQQELKLPLKKNLWKEIVQTKILNQSRSLEAAGQSGEDLRKMAKIVKSGDVSNVEAQAAKAYWRKLFGNDFRRSREGEGPNALLNYGYAILRAVVGRKICAVGLHPSVGINHSNRSNAFVLADDLMEPFRPLVDALVYELWIQNRVAVDRTTKEALLGMLNRYVWIDGRNQTLQNAAEIYVGSFFESIAQKKSLLKFPDSLTYEISEGEE